MATPGQCRIERRVGAILAVGMKRREFLASLLSAAAVGRAGAQQRVKVFRIAIVAPSAPVAIMSEEREGNLVYRVFFQQLRRLGYVEGQNLVVERHSGEGRTEHYADLARAVVRAKPDLVFAISSGLVQSFKAATATIPIVGITGDPIGFGLVSSLAHPGANITGVSLDA